MESFVERITREMNEIEETYPGVTQMIQEIRKAYQMSNMDIDYLEERDRQAFKAVERFLSDYELLRH